LQRLVHKGTKERLALDMTGLTAYDALLHGASPRVKRRPPIVKLSDEESLQIRGGHDDVAARLSRTTAAA